MYFRLKYKIYALIALGLAATSVLSSSCTGDDPDEPAQGAAMEFAVGAESHSSRANNAGFSEFAVFGDIKKIDTETNEPGEITKIMENVAVAYVDTAASWKYCETQYWFPKYEHSFVAINPSATVATNAQYSNSQLSFTYTLPTDQNRTADIVAATHRRYYEGGKAETVTLRFGHVMTQINVAAALDDNLMSKDGYIDFSKIEMSGFNTEATFNIAPAPLLSAQQTDDRVIEVTAQKGSGSMMTEFEEPKRVMNDKKYVSLLGDGLIMLPQSYGDDAEARITLTYKIDKETEQKRIEIPLKGQTWEPGKRYTYRFVIDRRGLRFEGTTIAEWKAMEVGNIDAK